MSKESVEIKNINKGRVLVLGDLHGGLKGLVQAIERANVTNEDKLIFLGDYVDGWVDSATLVTYLIELNKTHNCIFIYGNHDYWCRQYLEFGTFDTIWNDRGGPTTIASYNANHDSIDYNEHRKFFNKLHYYYIDDENRLYVHGGYKSDLGPRFESRQSELFWDRSLLENAFTMHQFAINDGENEKTKYMPKKLKLFKEIYLGHTTTLIFGDDKPLQFFNLWNLDTGAGTNGRVTIMDVDTKEYWQSDILTDLYPEDPHNEFAKLFKR